MTCVVEYVPERVANLPRRAQRARVIALVEELAGAAECLVEPPRDPHLGCLDSGSE
jgi:hypothetical protein